MSDQPWDADGYDPTEGGRLCGARKTGGTRRTTGSPSPWCRRWAGAGTDHTGIGQCSFHGGATPAATRHAQTERARQAVATFGLPVEVDPHTALLEEIHRTAGHVAYLAAKIAAFDDDDQLKQHSTDDDGRLWEKPAVWVRLYQDERSHLVAVCKAAVSAGVAERQVALAEQQGELLAKVMRAIFEDPDLDLTAGQRRLAPTLVRRHLALVAGDRAA